MNIAQHIKRGLHDSLGVFKWFERTIAVVCITIPLLLKLADIPYPGFRTSISAYVNMPRSYVFGMLLCMAAMLFIFNGAVYFKNEDNPRLRLTKYGKWYNIVLGLSLMMVILLPYYEFKYAHYFFAGLFFLGNAVVTALFHDRKSRNLSIFLAVLTVAALVLFFLKIFIHSLLVAEWISLVVIAIHFFLESRK